MRKEFTALVSGVGAPGIKGTIFCLQHNPENIPLRLIGIDMDVHAVGQAFVDRFYKVSAPESVHYLDEIKRIVKEEQVQLIIPHTTRETVFFAHHRPVFEALGVKVLVVSPEAVQVANNKYLTLQAFLRAGLPVGQHYLVDNIHDLQEAVAKLNYPHEKVVVKIPVANGMRGFRVLSEASLSLARFLNEKPQAEEISLGDFLKIFAQNAPFPELLVTEYLPGVEYSVDVFRNTQEMCIVPRVRKKIRSGISFVNQLECHNEIIAFSRKAAEIMGLFGVFGLQFKLDSKGIAKILECNPRIQGSMVASYFGGANIIWYGVAEVLGLPYEIKQDLDWQAQFYRYWGGVGIDHLCHYEIL